MNGNTIERILPNQMSETEFWNVRRLIHGYSETKTRITKIRPGLQAECGENCHIDEVIYGSYFIKRHANDCSFPALRDTIERVECNARGQAIARLRNTDNVVICGVMILDGLFPHEESRAAEFHTALEAIS